ncbi:hypothetical protein HYU23_02100 [Candidatus Woesearchaeota archaeon]|nr:hypothetical protein [Candidatus Woesearchaeota archaeon]
MAFLDTIKNWFKKKNNSFVKTVNIPPSEENKTETVEASEQKEHVQEEKIEVPSYNKEELIGILDSYKIDNKDFALEKIQSEAETIHTYVKGLVKDLNSYQDFKNEKEKIEHVIKSIGSKIKLITNHGLELKNLIANLENHYYEPLIDNIRKVNEKAKKEEIKNLISDLEHDKNLMKTLDTQITKVVGYNELFNPDKNPKFKEDIEKEATKRVVHGDLNDLLNRILEAVTDRVISAKSKIEKIDYIKIIKDMV